MSERDLMNLRMKDSLSISCNRYTVTGIVQFTDGGYSWREYKLLCETGEIEYLSIDEEGSLVTLFKSVKPEVRSADQSIDYHNKTYTLEEEGSAIVSFFVGNVDVELNEVVKYYEYSDEGKRHLFSIEDWDGDIENSIGHAVMPDDIIVKERAATTTKTGTTSSTSSGINRHFDSVKSSEGSMPGFIKWGAIGALALLLLIFGFSKVSYGKDAKKILEDDPTFTFVTAVTADQTGVESALVYKSSKSVPETAIYLISKSKPKEHGDLTNRETISLLYKDTYVFIYQGEEKETLVQYSTREYTYKSNNNLYRGRHVHYHSFYRDYYFYRALRRDSDRYHGSAYRSYTPSKDAAVYGGSTSTGSSTKSNSSSSGNSNSVKQNSSGSRNSQGGGTSFGK